MEPNVRRRIAVAAAPFSDRGPSVLQANVVPSCVCMDTQHACKRRRGRPLQYLSPDEAKRAANARQRNTMQRAGLVQRSVWLPREVWETVRALRLPTESSDAATLERLLREAVR
jgi:hypothetical protein